jgi:hypothetical protein
MRFGLEAEDHEGAAHVTRRLGLVDMSERARGRRRQLGEPFEYQTEDGHGSPSQSPVPCILPTVVRSERRSDPAWPSESLRVARK